MDTSQIEFNSKSDRKSSICVPIVRSHFPQKPFVANIWVKKSNKYGYNLPVIIE